MGTATSNPANNQAVPYVDTPLTPFEEKTGHHPSLFVLFFAEMWERFSYYGMRALLVFYMLKGFLHYKDNEAYGVYGAYTALVYMTPFIGGLVADKLLGYRACVILGGALMAMGHLVMTIESKMTFFIALALLIAGNGFFKPNIGAILGNIYGDRLKAKRDGAFTIFYMGVNLGAAMAPLLCGYVGETYGWHYGFGLATIGMLIGLAVFVAPNWLTQVLIGSGALAGASVLVYSGSKQTMLVLGVNAFVAVALVAAAGFAWVALNHGGVPESAGARPAVSTGTYNKRLLAVLLGTTAAVVLFTLLIMNKAAGILLDITGAVSIGYVLYSAFKFSRIERERIFVLVIMFFFTMLFWAFFEQAGSSINNFTDRNVDRVAEKGVITANDIGKTMNFELNQEQVGYPHIDSTGVTRLYSLTDLDNAKDAARKESERTGKDVTPKATWLIQNEHVGMKLGGTEIPASIFQSTNPIYILLFGLLFSWVWGYLGERGREPSTQFKFVLALLQLSAGFWVLWYAAEHADGRGMVGMSWLLLAYLLHTTGELCLSPVTLGLISKLSPKTIVATMMGTYYLGTAFSQYLAGIIATFTGVEEHGGSGPTLIPPPVETLPLYSDVFYKIAIATVVAAVLMFAISPILKKWTHEEAFDQQKWKT